MPRATIDRTGTHHDLKSLPEGFVVLRPLSFGELLQRRDMAMKFVQELNPNSRIDGSSKVTVDILNDETRRFDFTHCIVDHNLEDENGIKLNFQNPLTLDILDPRVAAEIERYLDKMNLEDFDDEVFTGQSEQSSTSTSETSLVPDSNNSESK